MLLDNPLVIASKRDQRLSWFQNLYGNAAVIRMTSISISRVFLFFPYIIYISGIANFTILILIVSGLYTVKAEALTEAWNIDGRKKLHGLIRRSFRRPGFLFCSMVELIGNLIDYVFLLSQVRSKPPELKQ